MGRWSQDGGVGRRGVTVSPQLGHLPATAGGLWHPRRWEEPQSELVGHRRTEWGEVEARQDQHPWGQGGKERQAGGTLQEEQERSGGRSPGPLGPGSLLSSQASTLPSKAPCRCCGSLGAQEGGWGEIRRGRWEGPSQTGGAGEETRAFALPTRAQEGCWPPRWGPLPSETRGGGHTWAFCSLSLNPTPHSPQRLFQPWGSEHWPSPPRKPGPCLGPILHSQGLSTPPFSFLCPPPLFYSCGTDVPSGCWFIYIFIFIFFLTYLLVS